MLEKERLRVNKNMRIGIIHTAFIGDIVLCGLLIEALHRSGHQIIFFTKKNTASIYRDDTRIARVIELYKPQKWRKLFALGALFRQIRSESIDTLLCPHRSLTTTLCAYFSKAKVKIGFKNATLNFLYTKTVPFKQNQHECLRYLNLLQDDFCAPKLTEELLSFGRTILRYPDSFFKNYTPQFLSQSVPYFIISMGSAWNTKKYKRDYFITICERLLKEFPELNLYLTGDKRDIDDCKFAQSKLSRFSHRVYNLADRISLQEFSAIIAKSRFIVSNDSSPIHFASAFNIPTICFFGPTIVEYGFGPTAEKSLILSYKTVFGQNLYCQPCSKHGTKQCPEGHHRCMKDLTPNSIFFKIKHFLRLL